MIYLVEDDDNIRELVVYTLNQMKLPTKGFTCPSEFWKALKNETPEMILLDIMLPEEDGLCILQTIRSDHKTKKLPVIMLTAKIDEYDRVKGLESGADDYITKPFGMMELVARIKAVLRRADYSVAQLDYRIDNMYVCPSKHIVSVDNVNISLTRKEFDLLCMLLANRGIVLTRDSILDQIWGYSFDGENRTVDVHIRTLRQKLGSAGELIHTIRGVGYKIN